MAASDLDTAMRTVAGSIRADATYFAPPDEDHFDPITVVIGLGGILVGAYCKGFVDQASSYAEEAGRATAAWLRARVQELFLAPDDTAAEAARAVAQEQIEAVRPVATGLAEGERARRAAETAGWLEAVILVYGVPGPRAAAIAASVADEATALIGASPPDR